MLVLDNPAVADESGLGQISLERYGTPGGTRAADESSLVNHESVPEFSGP